MNYQEEKKYIGHKDQLMKVKKIRMEDGKASGVEMVDIQNRSGMHHLCHICLKVLCMFPKSPEPALSGGFS